ncbi:MAG: hypothetical protein PHH02_01680 [Dehalococcoidales bacterium]|jgi:hypothetical protein|nr:hypothetical protein [Dehalococcoidales bacterium]MDD4793670.1 hypothetical protein [Dehalococcoidales bacterium]MDD5122869.1 hypothetical protein [Dehalococcoidales bacterium]MDX9802461.1 hypothetical protein [Dehalococcoidales bacterium]
MLQCLLSFLVGGGLLAFVTFIAQKGNATLTILVANIPVMFLLNVLMTYRIGGVDGSLNYAKGALMYLPFYIIFVMITMWLIPRLGMPGALLPGIPVFIIPVMIKRWRARINMRERLGTTAAQLAEAAYPAEKTGSHSNAAA